MNDLVNNQNEPLSVALYARVSTEKQEDEKTIESQIDEVKKKITEDGNILLKENIFIDDGWSGMMIARPALDLMRDASKTGKFQALYVYDLGRLSRDFTSQLVLLREFEEDGIKFISLRDINPTNPQEGFMQKMMGLFHDYDRVNTIEKFRRGKLFKAKNGVIINGHSLYGLKFVRSDPKEPLRCVIDEETAHVVRLIWNWFGIDQLSIYEIRNKLHEFGIKPRKGKSDFWTKGPIIRILRCDTYVTGKAYYNKSESIVTKHPLKDTKYKKVKKGSRRIRPREEWISFDVPKVIEDVALYDKIQKILDFNKDYKNKLAKYNYLLTGLIYCDCGNKRSGDGCSRHGHYYYRCNARIKSNPYPARCKSGGVNAEILDDLVWKGLKKHLSSYSLMKVYAEKWLKSYGIVDTATTVEKKRLTEMIIRVDAEVGRYNRAFGADTLSFEQLQELVKDANKRKESYKIQLTDLTSKTTKINYPITIDELVNESRKVISSFDFSNKLRTVRDIIQKVTVSENKNAEIWARLPLTVTLTERLGYEPQSGNSRSSKCR